MDSESEVGHFIEKLSTWKEETHKEFFNIVQFHCSSISKGINELVEEVRELQDKLSFVTKQRNDLLGIVHNLRNDNSQSSASKPFDKPLPEVEEIYHQDIKGFNNPSPRIEDLDSEEEYIAISNKGIKSESIEVEKGLHVNNSTFSETNN